MGKSLCIKNMTKVLSDSHHLSCVRITVPIHGPDFSVASLIESLAEHRDDNQRCVVHLDIAPNVSTVYSTGTTFCHNMFSFSGYVAT